MTPERCYRSRSLADRTRSGNTSAVISYTQTASKKGNRFHRATWWSIRKKVKQETENISMENEFAHIFRIRSPGIRTDEKHVLEGDVVARRSFPEIKSSVLQLSKAI